MPKLRLVRVVVHPILMLDDGENLTPFENGPSEIAAADWPGFADRLKADMAAVQATLDEADEKPGP